MEAARRRGLARLQLRWPARRQELALRAASDVRVGELCEAYETACAALDYWLHSAASIAPERVEEYRSLIIATEEDVLALINPRPEGVSPRRR